jgi:hypothetical protein
VQVKMMFRLEYDPATETVGEFGLKVKRFKEHVLSMQLKGTLPRGDVHWTLAPKKRSILLPGAVDAVHIAGDRLL